VMKINQDGEGCNGTLVSICMRKQSQGCNVFRKEAHGREDLAHSGDVIAFSLRQKPIKTKALHRHQGKQETKKASKKKLRR
jgi:hypothetical protein